MTSLPEVVTGINRIMERMELEFKEQKKNLERVSDRIAGHIKTFLSEEVGVGGEFYAADLYKYCEAQMPKLAPSSPDRVMRSMASKGKIEYTVVDRRQSLYRLEQIL